jgi:hypothetical protein
MHTSSKYKKQAFAAKEIQEAWIPEMGDFWHCACSSCMENDRAWVLEQADVLAIDPTVNLDNFYRDVKNSAMTSMDCGFGAFWLHRHEETSLPFVWLPRIDQLLDMIMKELFKSDNNIGEKNVSFCLTLLSNWVIYYSKLGNDASVEEYALEMLVNLRGESK